MRSYSSFAMTSCFTNLCLKSILIINIYNLFKNTFTYETILLYGNRVYQIIYKFFILYYITQTQWKDPNAMLFGKSSI